MDDFYKGNLNTDREKSLALPKGKEWLIGNFDKFKNDIRKTDLLELKYWEIRKGDEKKHAEKIQKSVGEITIIVEGKVRGFIGKSEMVLEKDEYVYIPPGISNNLIVEIMECDKIKGLTFKAPSDGSDFKKNNPDRDALLDTPKSR